MLPGENRTQFILSFVILLLNTSELDSPSILNITKLQTKKPTMFLNCFKKEDMF